MSHSISMSEFEKKMEKETIHVVDVREKDEWEKGHLKEAIHVPLSDFDKAKGKLDKNQAYYIICHSGRRSAIACERLSEDGYAVTNVEGGMTAWEGEIIQ